MTRDEIKTLTLRVTEANAFGLIVILYDGVLIDIKGARAALAKGDEKEYTARLHHATRFLNELINNLNFEVTLSHNLMSLYSYCNRQISYAVAGRHAEALDIVEEVIKMLRQSFKTLSENDTSGPVMSNTQSVYAGLTYGKGYLNESFVDAKDYNRGFRA